MENLTLSYASVSDVVRRIKADVEGDYRLKNVAMEGNIINLKKAAAGHYYMTLHDEHCALRAVLFRSRVGRSMDGVREGDHVIVIGSVDVYEKGGSVSFVIERLFTQGMGSLQAQYEEMKRRLAAEGCFDSDHKVPLPRFAWNVTVITSPAGAVLHDIYKIRGERNPYVHITVSPVPVQGEGAGVKIAAAIAAAGKDKQNDVLIVARGGGSMEDLWCFNSPDVVQAIYQSQVPVITAIGHETDTTLADYAADVRAATPTHAAELAFFDMREVEMDLAALVNQAYEQVTGRIDGWQEKLQTLQRLLRPDHVDELLDRRHKDVHYFLQQAYHQVELTLARKEGDLRRLQAGLSAMDPASLLKKGYGQLSQEGRLISSVKDVKKDVPLDIQLLDGAIESDVKEVTIYGKDNG